MNASSSRTLFGVLVSVLVAATTNEAHSQSTTPAAFTSYNINGGSCTGLSASDRAILSNRAGAIDNVGTRNATVTCHAPSIERGHIYRVNVYMRYNREVAISPFRCTLFGGSGWGTLTNYGLAQQETESTGEGGLFELFWGWTVMYMGNSVEWDLMTNAEYPIQRQPVNIQCILPPRTQLLWFKVMAVQDQQQNFFDRTPY